jgi:type IV pilus assembly protein PilB
VLALLPRALALKHLVLPLSLEGDRLRVALSRPDDARVREAVAHASGRPLIAAVALRHELRRAVESCYGRLDGGPSWRPRSAVTAAPAPSRPAAPVRENAARVSDLPADLGEPLHAVNSLLRAAVQQGATDVHFEPAEDGLGVRFRVDGILRRVADLPKSAAGPVTSRLKVLGRMDIAERRVPQDGRASMTLADCAVDLRISSLPAQFGEKIVLRLLRKDTNLLDVANLHMPADVRHLHAEMIEAPMGLFLVTGPTGSGKTTTLYATLNAIDRVTLNVVTLEDPIEYTLPGITQVQIHEAAGMSFAAGLHSILRQDPDVILVGEIRDVATAEIACRSALTGHKVLSTLHTNDSCQAVTRLLEMGVSPHLVTATLRGVAAQRLLRKICDACRTLRPATEVDRHVLHRAELREVAHGAGCPTCAGSGYRGRQAIYEYFRLKDTHHRLVLDRASPLVLRLAAVRDGMSTMLEHGRMAALEGLTTPAEIQRVLLADDAGGPPCPGCGRPVGEDYTHCPFCQRVLQETCASCSHPVQAEWQACPRCGEALARQGEVRTCGRCSGALEAGWTTCPYCGEASA